MLKNFSDLSPKDQALCLKNGWIAYDPKTGSTLLKVSEASKPGQPAKYHFSIPNLMLRVIWVKTDHEAIDNANLGKK